ncbi:hypothetical protein FQN50_007732 [Emmonsiellopsis sp. PD_5]|nr:hypothetical protein FQN50_007732 [Emmonsiellopsis sp. PD_5]
MQWTPLACLTTLRGSLGTDSPGQSRNREAQGSQHQILKEIANTADYIPTSGLRLTFSHEPKGYQGFTLGRERNECDIVLDTTYSLGASGSHCYLTFDDQNRLILRDKSRNGTIVSYNERGAESRQHFTWIVDGNSIPDKTFREVEIKLSKTLKFRIVTPNHHTHMGQYIANIEKFRTDMAAKRSAFQRGAAPEAFIDKLGLASRTTTVAHSKSHTPNQNPIYLTIGQLGTGAFAVVDHFWNVSTGVEYACKRPSNKNKFRRVDWEKEIDILGCISHEHIVELLLSEKQPLPLLYLEYLPLGNLSDINHKRPISYGETLTILRQGLSALEYLHELERPIAHRDIKPANILVLSRDPLHMKLADFGLAKEGSHLETLCGTLTYEPPEILNQHTLQVPREIYTKAVDIWSLGVVILRFAYGFPKDSDDVRTPWCTKIVKKVNSSPGPLAAFLSTAMLVEVPAQRYSARRCLGEVQKLFSPSRSSAPAPTPASNTNRDQRTAIYHGAKNPVADSYHSALRSSKIDEYIKSNAQPLLAAQTRKRRSSASSTSSTSTITPAKHRVKTLPFDAPPHQQPVGEYSLWAGNWLQNPDAVGSSVADLGQESPSGWSSMFSDSTMRPSKIRSHRNVSQAGNEPQNNSGAHRQTAVPPQTTRPLTLSEQDLARQLGGGPL